MNVVVNEVFETIQGEAGFTGTPAVFVRMQGCGVGCPWCDTRNTWASDVVEGTVDDLFERDGQSGGVSVDVDGLVNQIASRFRARHVVITGGEPLEQPLEQLIDALLALNYRVQIETSGTASQVVRAAVFVTLSPKVGMPGGRVVQPDMMLRANEIKMPVGRQRDIDTLQQVLSMPRDPSAEVWLQPISASKPATELCVSAATRYGWRVSLQTHKFLGVR